MYIDLQLEMIKEQTRQILETLKHRDEEYVKKVEPKEVFDKVIHEEIMIQDKVEIIEPLMEDNEEESIFSIEEIQEEGNISFNSDLPPIFDDYGDDDEISNLIEEPKVFENSIQHTSMINKLPTSMENTCYDFSYENSYKSSLQI